MSRRERASRQHVGRRDPAPVFGCLSDLVAARRLDRAMGPDARILWWPTFADLRAALTREPRHVIAVVINVEDPTGASAIDFARGMAGHHPGTGIVVHQRD